VSLGLFANGLTDIDIYHTTNYGKNEKPGKYTFFRTNETYSTYQHVAIATPKHNGFITHQTGAAISAS
jgi:hypothetical protein